MTYPAKFSEAMMSRLRERKNEAGVPINTQIRQAVEEYLDGATASPTTLNIPLLGPMPCGPFRAALNEARMVDLGDLADVLRVKPDDFLVEADGVSMESDNLRRHIPNGSWILFRPNLYPDGEAVLVRAEMEDGECRWSVKRWITDEDGVVELRDGRNRNVEAPILAAEVSPVAVMRGLIAPFAQGALLAGEPVKRKGKKG